MSTASTKRRDRRLWIPVVGPSMAWATALVLSFVLVSDACATGRRWILLAVSGSALAAAVWGAGAAWRSWKQLQNGDGTPGERRRFMAVAGLILAAYFVLVILALSIPQIVHRPCD